MSASPSKSHFLSPGSPSPRKGPRSPRSTSSLRGGSISMGLGGGNSLAPDSASHSLAHELAFALMPEPNAGSKLLAEEFGIEYDEGAEGIDELAAAEVPHGFDGDGEDGGPRFTGPDANANVGEGVPELQFHAAMSLGSSTGSGNDATLARRGPPERDAMDVLARDIESTDKFLSHLRRLDADGAPSTSTSASTSAKAPASPLSTATHATSEPQLEKITLDIIRRINETARDREGQVRELIGLEREFRRIAGEVGGSDVLGTLDELEEMDGLMGNSKSSPQTGSAGAPTSTPSASTAKESESTRGLALETVDEDGEAQQDNDWEADLERSRLAAGEDDELDPEFAHSLDPHSLDLHHHGDGDDLFSPTSPTSKSFPPDSTSLPPLPPLPTDPSPAETLPHLAHMRTLTTSLVTSLLTISEHAQVNGVATTEAGRKLRALKNKLGEWRDEWEGAERSRVRIEKWEAGEAGYGKEEGKEASINGISRRVDGRKIVEEQLREFERALADAAVKTQAIMSSA